METQQKKRRGNNLYQLGFIRDALRTQQEEERENSQASNILCYLENNENALVDVKVIQKEIRSQIQKYELMDVKISQIVGNNQDQEKLEEKDDEDWLKGKHPFFQKGYQDMKAFKEYHSKILNQMNYKFRAVVNIAKSYIEEIRTNPNYRFFMSNIESGIDNLESLVHNSDELNKTSINIQCEFQRIEQSLQQKLTLERNSIKKKEEFGLNAGEKPNKSTMTTLNLDREYRNAEEDRELGNIRNVKIKVSSDEITSNLLSETKNDLLIAFSDKNSYLAIGKQAGISLKDDRGLIYSKKPSNIENARQVVYAKNGYFIYDSQQQLILRKEIDESEPVIWWKKMKIQDINCIRAQLRVDPAENFVAVNVDDTKLILIEIKADNLPGEVIQIDNTSGSRIEMIEFLSKTRMLTMTKSGLITLLELDLDNYSSKILFRQEYLFDKTRGENYFNISVCPRSEYFALYTSKSWAGSRIIIYRISQNRFEKVNELDIYSENLHHFHSICFSNYFSGSKLLLCGYSVSEGSSVLVYQYDAKSNEIAQYQEISVPSENYCLKLHRLDSQVSGLLNGGKLLRICFETN